jgi:hypothetical protein
MDQGIVAILTSAVAAFAGVGGAAAGALVTAKGARNQARDQASIEHAQWLRQGRSTAYQSFLECLYVADVAASRAQEAAANSTDQDEREGLSTAIGDLRRLQWQVITFGPQHMGELARQAYEMAQHAMAAIITLHINRGLDQSERFARLREEANECRMEILAARAAFAEGAAVVLGSVAE